MNEEQMMALLEEAKGTILEYECFVARLLAAPLVYATVVKARNEFNLEAFEQGDLMLIIDREWRKNDKRPRYGKIASKGVDKEDNVTLALPNGACHKFSIGLKDAPVQVKLLGKDDGTNCVIVFNGQQYEVHGVPGKKFHPSEVVKVDLQSYQIHDKAETTGGGTICGITRLIDKDHAEVDVDGRPRQVLAGLTNVTFKPGDRVVLDPSDTVIVRLLEREGNDRFNLLEDSQVTWDDIAGVRDAKEQLVEAIELPYQFPELYRHYNKRPPKGVLLFGPPGCGKTLCAKAAAFSIAKIHEKPQMQSGFIYVKGPELLSKWVGESERQIRELFDRGREHHEKHGYPALLFIDEADAIMPQRGTGKSSDVEKTIVPMFLSEMDGLETSKVMVVLATNQPNSLDPAVVREGRIDRHVRIGRPTTRTAIEYFRIHLRNIPTGPADLAEIAAHTTAEIFSQERVLYKFSNGDGREHYMTLGDCISGAMIAGIVDLATSCALKRDMASKTGKGTFVRVDDFRAAVHQTYLSHVSMNASFDIDDFIERKGLSRCGLNIEKLRPDIAAA